MPELPEVETVVRQLERVLPGKEITSVEVLKEKSFDSAQDKSVQVVGKKIVTVTRKQKIVVMELSGELVILIHLKMTGQLIYQGIEKRIVGGHPTADWLGTLPSKHTRVVIHFADKSVLYFNDQRVFGWVKVVPSAWWLVLSEKMPPDVVDVAFTQDYLARILKQSRRAVKLVILDQDKIGGMGNIYANDALYLARINPRRAGNRVQGTEISKLYNAMKNVIAKGIETGGASYSHFVDTQGLGGHYQDQFLVYNKAGERCQNCHSIFEKISLGGRGTYFCPKCQR